MSIVEKAYLAEPEWASEAPDQTMTLVLSLK